MDPKYYAGASENERTPNHWKRWPIVDHTWYRFFTFHGVSWNLLRSRRVGVVLSWAGLPKHLGPHLATFVCKGLKVQLNFPTDPQDPGFLEKPPGVALWPPNFKRMSQSLGVPIDCIPCLWVAGTERGYAVPLPVPSSRQGLKGRVELLTFGQVVWGVPTLEVHT